MVLLMDLVLEMVWVLELIQFDLHLDKDLVKWAQTFCQNCVPQMLEGQPCL